MVEDRCKLEIASQSVNVEEVYSQDLQDALLSDDESFHVEAEETDKNTEIAEKNYVNVKNTEVAEENYINEDISDNNQVIASCSRNELGEINENEIEKEQTTEEKAHIQANESGKADENYDYWEETTEGEENVKITAAHNLPICQRQNFKDDFAESLGEDLENGAFFVEAYNDSGRELVIVEISIERKTVDFDKLESIRNSIKNADIVFHQSEGQILNLVEEPVYENMEILSNGNDLGSNRSTIYSITSRESGVFDDDDEGISMGHTEGKASVGEDNTYNNVRRETFWDNRGIVRIERVGCPGSHPLSYIIEEIKSTEKKYVADLEKVIKKYIPYIDKHTPPDKQGRQYYIFGNMLTLWEHQKGFLAALENCVEEAEEIARTFIDFKDLFKLYPKYFKNKPKADVVLKEFSPIIKQAQERFKERLDLSAYLLTPLQRLGKYKLFLENIEKQLFKLNLPSDSTTTALEIIKQEMSKGNDSVAIASIDSSPIDKSEYGSFKMREIFIVLRPRRFEAMIFLFENLIVFTTLGSPKKF
ncbi:hypothetical protein NQ317_005679 [Molorchus minor]|uniref:DH domain-containing protein n=1 Tax=Molorchus minor TaxID=1323400 RepID=A0ABQ9J8N4_9CUCU|nr:hypothetical protein NQ317_005679 [Molorchus minor]